MTQQQQDSVLDDMSQILNRLSVTNSQISDELVNHQIMLNDVDQSMEEGQQKLNLNIKKTNRLNTEVNKGRICCIIILIVIVIILIAILMST